MKYTGIILGLLTVVGAMVCAQAGPDPSAGTDVHAVRAYLDTLEQTGFSGAVLVEHRGKEVISQGYGYREVRHRRRNSPQTVFDIGSITKQFTAAAILKLEMEGRLSTDDTLSLFFDNVPGDKSKITIHHLLRHSSGLQSVVGGDYDRITEARFVDTVMKSPLKFASGTAFSYSNIGYSLLAIIIEKISGMSYETYLYENLWRPARMEMTGYRRPDFREDLIATGYDNDDRIWGKPTEKAWDSDGPYWHLKGNGGILSTTEDLFKWTQALSTDSILSANAKGKMYHPRLRDAEDSSSYYAYGWDVRRTDRNTMVLWHNGTNGIFYADLYRYVDEGTTIIVLTNKSNGFEGTGREIFRALFDPGYRPSVPIADNKANRFFTDHIITLTIQQGIEVGVEEFGKRHANINLLEGRVNERGYELLKGGNLGQAADVFRLNVFAFPGSSNAYDSLGEAYMAAGDTILAIENYRKSLALDPANGNAKDILERILGK
jgi:CubicO group peptidase (beta-lactamase class C family)